MHRRPDLDFRQIASFRNANSVEQSNIINTENRAAFLHKSLPAHHFGEGCPPTWLWCYNVGAVQLMRRWTTYVWKQFSSPLASRILLSSSQLGLDRARLKINIALDFNGPADWQASDRRQMWAFVTLGVPINHRASSGLLCQVLICLWSRQKQMHLECHKFCSRVIVSCSTVSRKSRMDFCFHNIDQPLSCWHCGY